MNITNYFIGFLLAFCFCLLIDIRTLREEIKELYYLFEALYKSTNDRFNFLEDELDDKR